MGRTKLALQYLPVIEACMKLEDMAYMEAMREKHLPSSAQLWSDRGAIDVYMVCAVLLAPGSISTFVNIWLCLSVCPVCKITLILTKPALTSKLN